MIPTRFAAVRATLLSTRSALLITLILAMGLVITHESLSPSEVAAETTFTFDGGGWGHGVGMSQYGAKGRADAGQSAATIIAAYYTGTQISTVVQPNVRVHLADTASTTILFSTATTITGNGGPLASVVSGETVEFTAVGSAYQLQIISPTPKAIVAIAANDVVVAPLNGNPARLSATGNRYNNGRLVIRLASAGTLQVVNESLTMQQYVNGLGEVPSSWPIEALKAQALAARTYAYNRLLTPRTSTYDILSTTSDQVYVGYEKEVGPSGNRWVDAVTATNQQIITYNGAPIDALYGSSNGGYSEDSEYAFVSALPYLRANPDPFDNAVGNPNFRWSRSYTGAELGQYVTAYRGVNIGPVSSYQVSGNTSRVGRIDRANVKLVGTSGSVTITGSQLRDMINRNAPANRQLLSTLLFFHPIGSFDGVSIAPGIVRVNGWALFQGNTAPALAHVYVNDQFAGSIEATDLRPDVAAAVPGASPNVGFSVPVTVDRAVNTVCAYAVTPAGNNSALLGCRAVTVETQPFGAFDFASATPGGVHVGGWAADPNSAGPTDVHVYINGKIAGSLHAAGTRNDVAAAFPGYGASHGFDATFPVDQAINAVCAYAINVGPGEHQLLGCRGVVNSVQPFGVIDRASGTPDGVQISGWAIDPDTVDPIAVHVYVDNTGTAITANSGRPDVAAVFSGYGANHGYSSVIPTSPGIHTACAFAINVRAGDNQLIGCRTVFVPADPFGAIDVVKAAADGIHVSGWAIDPNTSDPIDVHIYVANAGTPVRADHTRSDVGAVFPASGAQHGYDAVVAGHAGQTVCAYAINTGPGATQTLGCRTAS